MRQKDVEIPGRYTTKVSGMLVTVRVFSACTRADWKGKMRTRFRAVNERTGRDLELTAARLRAPAPAATCEACGGDLPCENYRCHTSPAAAAYYERIGREDDAAARACGREELPLA